MIYEDGKIVRRVYLEKGYEIEKELYFCITVDRETGGNTIITSKKGAVRGNHFHKESTQYTFIVKGKFRLYRAKVDNQAHKALTEKSDWQGIKHVSIWIAALLFTGYMAYQTWGTWWTVLWLWLYGVLFYASNPIWHECGHRTAFKSKYLNEIFTVTREGKDKVSGEIQTTADYSELGVLLIVVTLLTLILPIVFVFIINNSKYKTTE